MRHVSRVRVSQSLVWRMDRNELSAPGPSISCTGGLASIPSLATDFPCSQWQCKIRVECYHMMMMKSGRLQFCRNPPLQYHPAQLSCLCILTETELGGGGPGKISVVMQSCKQGPGRYWRHHHITHSSHTEALVQEILSTE